ncbi:MAG: transglutaminase-like cysteine peptidase [Alphaproteobacteria bacterium]|jgi:predicted transglutaminase-like cysteine proteinase|nr:transglutaminase-like cysteine peptidase [Alphaproteobacteria bacterium]
MRTLSAALLVAVMFPLAAHADLFGRPSVRTTNIQSIPKWTEVLRRTEDEDLVGTCQSGTCRGLRNDWWERLAEWRTMGRYEQMVQVHRWVNRQPYIEDIDNWGRSDYWETPTQFLTRSGDCEDYSIAKYYTLKALGWPESALRLVVLRDTVRGIAHAVLAVKLGDEQYILDNLSNEPLPDRLITQYSPYYAINAQHRWVFLRPE